MSAVTSVWSHATSNRTVWLATSAGLVVLGVLIIAAGAVWEWGWTRLVGAGLISLGAVVFGVLVGWSDPLRPRIAAALYQQRKVVVVALAALMVAPLFAALLVGLGGLIAGAGSVGWAVVLTGMFITVFLAVLTAGSAGIGIMEALRGVDRMGPDNDARGNGRAEP